ncbi:MAG: MBL fold metallo-hydrolase [Patescibacteria group bacterium]
MVNIKKFVAGPIKTNVYVIYDLKKRGALIDPGFPNQEIRDFINKEKIDVVYILITHGHFDHVCDAKELRAQTGAVIAMAENDLAMAGHSHNWVGRQMGYELKNFSPDLFLKEGQIIKVGEIEIKVLATPGHSPGGSCFYLEKEKILFSGDTLFASAVGRTDLPFANEEEIWKSIREKLFVLPDDTRVLPGHGKETTIGQEKII